MLATDLNGLWSSLKKNQIFHLFILLGICILLYKMMMNYVEPRNNFVNTNINMLYNLTGKNNMPNMYCKDKVINLDEAIIRNMINLPNRNPEMLTTSLVVPEPTAPSDEERRKTRMSILNMFYSTFDDDLTSIKARPQNLYIIP
jgi:hypothetical protein